MALTLVILAAGIGSRFGGIKQLEPFGPNGETLMDFSIYDARRSGFDKVVLIIRRELRDAFERSICDRWRANPVVLCFQELDDLPRPFTVPAERSRPWGTVQALLTAEPSIDGLFAVINADDFYGTSAFSSVSGFLRDTAARATWSPGGDHALVGFPLRNTLGDGEPVNRALLRVSADGFLEEIEEIIGIERSGDDGLCRSSDGVLRKIPGEALVSMNMWGFTHSVFAQLKTKFRDFLMKDGDDPRSEFQLSTFVASLIREGNVRVRVLAGGDAWCGVTHPGDRPRAERFLRTLVDRGYYPPILWR